MERPVPLVWHYCFGRNDATHMRPLLHPGGRRINPELTEDSGDNEWFGQTETVSSARQRSAAHHLCELAVLA